MESTKTPHEHTIGRWEFNPKLEEYTRRCPGCGKIGDRIDLDSALASGRRDMIPLIQDHADSIRIAKGG